MPAIPTRLSFRQIGFRRWPVGVFTWAVLALPLLAADMTPGQQAFFENKIRPVLVKQCYECHSQGAKKIGGSLLLDAPAEMIAGGESGPSLIPGKPEESLIIEAVRYAGLEMPPKKKLPDQVVNDFVTWVKMGAPDPREDFPKPATKRAEEIRKPLWSLQPVTTPQIPVVKAQNWPQNAVDCFVLAQVEARGLSPANNADPATLVRRVYFDLIGLPPTAEETAAFAQQIRHSPAAYETLVDHLLQSPHFGERWGRHWLDVARYAESNGNDGLSRNPTFPHAWRYRDYVIRSLNADIPYDRFITQQIAGDLLPSNSPAERDQNLIATGFLALGSKPAKAMNDNFEMDVVADQIQVIGQGLLGLSVGCARCHDHKTDPIPTRDYYALAGIFKSTETLWGAAALQGLTAPQTPLHALQASAPVKLRPEVEPVIKANKPRRPPAKPAFSYPETAALAMGVREAKAVIDCKLNIDGESKKLGPVIPRGFLTACGDHPPALNPPPTQSGRLELARWLTHPGHPLTARVIVNRLWQHLFGEGLVRTPDDFGVTGEPPTHPELLDHLASRFTTSGWSIKQLIRSIVLSRSYQLSSQCPPALRQADPDNTLFARHNRRRLDAESLRDAMLAASGDLNPQAGQGSLIQDLDVLINELPPLHHPSSHRSVYLLFLRNSMPPELTPFNLPDATTVTGKRDSSTLATQSLYLLNHSFLVRQSQRFAQRLMTASDDDTLRVEFAYRHAFARSPTAQETRRALDFIREADASLASSQHSSSHPLSNAWAAFCQALLASSEMRYVD